MKRSDVAGLRRRESVRISSLRASEIEAFALHELVMLFAVERIHRNGLREPDNDEHESIYFGRSSAHLSATPPPRGRPGEGPMDSPFRFDYLDAERLLPVLVRKVT